MVEDQIVIQDNDIVWRRVLMIDGAYYCAETNSPTSSAFKLRKDETYLSVDLQRLTTYMVSIADTGKYLLFSLEVHQIRSDGADCEYKPIPTNQAHCGITFPEDWTRSRKNRYAGDLARKAVRVAES